MKCDLTGRTAVVTGSSSGIGRAIALELAAAGADVLLHSRASIDAANEVAGQVRDLGRESNVLIADLSDISQHEILVENAWSWRGGVDIWVNNAGADVLTRDKADWTFDDKLDYLWQVDVRAAIRLSRLAGHRMKQAVGGDFARSIVNIGWDQAEHGMAGDSGEMFATTKGAVMAFTRSLAASLAPEVRVNCLAPGWIRTAWGEEATDYWQQRARRESLLGRWGRPEDVARSACFLVSPNADFITGQVIAINGGFRGAGSDD